MAQVITTAGEQLFAIKAQNNQPLDIDTFIFAYVPGQDSSAAIDRNEGLPPVGQRVHQQIVQQRGRVNSNVVIYSTVLDSVTGPFEFNWVGLYSSVNNTLVAISKIPTVVKTVTVPGTAGNILNRNFGIEYSGIAELEGITVDPETWQLDYTARLNGMDELTRQLAADMNGRDWFIDNGFKVAPLPTPNNFKVTAGAGYVSGLRIAIEEEPTLIAASYPQFVYVNAWFDGTSEATWKGQTTFQITPAEQEDYTDETGKRHYLFKLATITAANTVIDHRSGRATSPHPGIKYLLKVPGIKQTTLSFHTGLGVGGGDYIWLPDADQSKHLKRGPNGGILWAAAALDLYDGTPATLQALLNWVGVGYGCFELIGLKQLTAQNFGAGQIFDSYRPLQAAADFASANRMKLDIEIELVSSQKIYIASNTEIEIKTGGSISANDDFEGQHLIQVGAILQLAENVRLYGSGVVDGKNKCDISIDVHFSRFSEIGVKQVIGGNLRGIRIGHPDALAASYEVNISDDTTVWLGDVANDSNSIGVYHEKATDCYVTKTFSRGYRRSFANSPVSASIEYQMCHGWNRPENGPLVVVFDADGSQSTYVQCYADTPTNYGDSSINQVYGWRLNGFSPQLIACRIFINQSLTPNIAVTDLVKAVHFERELYGNIFGFKSAGGFHYMRYASLVSGPTETSTVMGLVDDGPSGVVDIDTRKENFTNQKVFEFINGLKVNSFAALTAPAGTALPISLQRDGIERIQLRLSGNEETGLNAGSEFQLNAYSDDGDYLATMLQVNRKFKKLQAIEGLQISKQLEFSNSYRVSTLPIGEPRALVYIENGDSGDPCFGVYVNGVWRRIAIGPAISTSAAGDIMVGLGSSSVDRSAADYAALAAKYGSTYVNLGDSGTVLDQHAAIIGARPATVNVTGGNIPATGSVVVTVTNIAFPKNVMNPIAGTIAGIHGTMAWDAGIINMVFTRSTAGSVTPVTNGTPLIPDANVYRSNLILLEGGKNDISQTSEDAINIIEKTKLITDWLAPEARAIVVIGQFVDANFGIGERTRLADVNAGLSVLYEDYFVDQQAWFTSSEIWDQLSVEGYIPTAEDLADQVAGDVPRGLMTAGRDHLTPQAYSWRAKYLIEQKLNRLGIYN